MATMQIGTSHFVSLEHAAKYYSTYYEGNPHAGRKIAEHKLMNGEIHIGPPELKSGETLEIIDGDTRYAIIERKNDTGEWGTSNPSSPEARLKSIKLYCEDVRSGWFDSPEVQKWMTNILILAGFK